jgi:hypothetical protein
VVGLSVPLILLKTALKDTLIMTFTELTSTRVVIVKGASKLDIIGRLRGFNRGIALAASCSRYNTIDGRDLITTSGLNGNRPIFSQDLLILYSLSNAI